MNGAEIKQQFFNIVDNEDIDETFVYQFMNHGWATQQVYEEAAKLYVIAMEAYTQRRLFADQQQREHDPVNDEKEM